MSRWPRPAPTNVAALQGWFVPRLLQPRVPRSPDQRRCLRYERPALERHPPDDAVATRDNGSLERAGNMFADPLILGDFRVCKGLLAKL